MGIAADSAVVSGTLFCFKEVNDVNGKSKNAYYS